MKVSFWYLQTRGPVLQSAENAHTFCISSEETTHQNRQDQVIVSTYNFAVMQSLVWRSVFRDPSLIVPPICVFETWIRNNFIRNIFHKNREISLLTIKKKHSKIDSSSGSCRKNQSRKDRTNKKKTHTHTSMNKSASLTPVQGQLTVVVCMIVIKLPQLPHWLHQVLTVHKGPWQAPTCELSFCCNSGSNGKTQPYYWASNRPQQQGQDKKQTDRGKEKLRKGQQGKTMNKWAYKKLHNYKTWNKIFWKTPKVEIPKINFSLISNPLVLFRRIFKG